MAFRRRGGRRRMVRSRKRRVGFKRRRGRAARPMRIGYRI